MAPGDSKSAAHSTITLDIGTTSVKACLFSGEGALVVTEKYPTPTMTDAFGEVYDVEALWALIKDFIRGVDPLLRAGIRHIAITGVGESGGLVRGDLSLASPMILWHDQRGAPRLRSLSAHQRERIYRVTGLPTNANYSVSKVAWAVQHCGEIADATWLNIAEYLAALLTGERWAEPSLASRTMALDLSTGAWSEELTGMFDLDVSVFPALRLASDGATITASSARETGVDADVRVHVAGHDHMVGGIGANLKSGEILNSTGTTEGILILRDQPRIDERAEADKLSNGRDCTGSGFTVFASIPTGGSAFATLQTMLGLSGTTLSAMLDDLYARYCAGHIRLDEVPLVLPQFRGSPPPSKRSSARGLIAGISNNTTADAIVFGTFLGMALQFRDVLGLFHTSASTVKVIGPASGNLLWLQLKADVLGMPLSVSRFPEVVSRGAQALACQLSPAWEDNAPFGVEASDTRRSLLGEWAAECEPTWAYLKGLPG